MSTAPDTVAGRQLYHLLPEVYRSRDHDEGGDLAAYLGGLGLLLDRLRLTLDQRLADCFPDEPLQGLACQSWLLPYFAELLGARLVSPDPSGQRAEVAQAIAWRQSKGTLATVEQVAQAVGRLEVEVQEGWKRVAVTPRIGVPAEAASAPARPAGTVRFGLHSRALQTAEDDPAGRTTRFGEREVRWRQGHPSGAPCFPGSYEDVSACTADLRSPDWRRGHVHPRRLLLFYPPPPGFFPYMAEPLPSGDLELAGPGPFVFEGLSFPGTIRVPAGQLVLRNSAVRRIEAGSNSIREPAIVDAADSLIEEIAAPSCLVRLEHVTVLGELKAARLQASDCLFAGSLAPDPVSPSCVRYSRVPPGLAVFSPAAPYHNTAEPPLFVELDFPHGGDGGEVVRRPARYGEPGCGVLHPAAPPAIRFGAEDGGEMGAHHRRRYCLAEEAVRRKLEDFLPVGLEAVLIPDPRLLAVPPRLRR